MHIHFNHQLQLPQYYIIQQFHQYTTIDCPHLQKLETWTLVWSKRLKWWQDLEQIFWWVKQFCKKIKSASTSESTTLEDDMKVGYLFNYSILILGINLHCTWQTTFSTPGFQQQAAWLLPFSSSLFFYQLPVSLLQLMHPPWMCILLHATTQQHPVSVAKMLTYVSSACR